MTTSRSEAGRTVIKWKDKRERRPGPTNQRVGL